MHDIPFIWDKLYTTHSKLNWKIQNGFFTQKLKKITIKAVFRFYHEKNGLSCKQITRQNNNLHKLHFILFLKLLSQNTTILTSY